MKKANTSYSRYYMPTANALAPEFEEEVVVRPQPAVRKQKRTQPFLAMTLPNLMRLACAFVLGVLLVGQYIYIQGLGYTVSQNKAKLESVLVQNEKLKQEYAAASSLETIESYAVNNMGMSQPGENVAYLPEREQSVVNGDAQNVTEDAENAANDGVLATIEGITGRFGF